MVAAAICKLKKLRVTSEPGTLKSRNLSLQAKTSGLLRSACLVRIDVQDYQTDHKLY
jgi:hypothetical protein